MPFRRAVNFLAIAILVISIARLMTRNGSGSATLPPAASDPLAVRVPAMDFSGTTLRQGLAQLSKASGVSISLDPGLGDDDYTLNLDAGASTLGTNLNHLLDPANWPVGVSYQIQVEGGTVRIFSPVQQPRMVRIYDVRDIWRKYCDELWEEELSGKPSVPTQGLFVQTGAVGGGYMSARRPSPTRRHTPPTWAATQADAMDDLLNCVLDNVTPQDWTASGGNGAWARGANGRLAVYHNAAGHREVEALLQAIRTADDIHGTAIFPPGRR